MLELGIGIGLFARFFLDAFKELCARENKDYYRRLTYVAGDRSERMLADACRHGVFVNHAGHYLIRVVDAMDPRPFLIGDPAIAGEQPFRAVFLNYLLDCLPAADLKIKDGAVSQLCVRTCLARNLFLGEYSAGSLAHRSLADLIETSTDFNNFRQRLQAWANQSTSFIPGGARALPEGLRLPSTSVTSLRPHMPPQPGGNNWTWLLPERVRRIANTRVPLPGPVVRLGSRAGALLRAGGRIASRALGPLTVALAVIDLKQQIDWAKDLVAIGREIDRFDAAIRDDFRAIFQGENVILGGRPTLQRGANSRHPYSAEEFEALSRYYWILRRLVNELPEGWYDWSIETIGKRDLKARLDMIEAMLFPMDPRPAIERARAAQQVEDETFRSMLQQALSQQDPAQALAALQRLPRQRLIQVLAANPGLQDDILRGLEATPALLRELVAHLELPYVYITEFEARNLYIDYLTRQANRARYGCNERTLTFDEWSYDRSAFINPNLNGRQYRILGRNRQQ